MVVARKVRRHPVDDDAESGLVTAIDEAHEVMRRAEACGRRVVADDLVAPRLVERMLGDRHQLEMRVAELERVSDELVAEILPAQEWALTVVGSAPCARMHLVDVDRAARSVAARAGTYPVVVAPRVAIERCDDRAVLRPQLHRKAIRIGLQERPTARAADLIFIGGARTEV